MERHLDGSGHRRRKASPIALLLRLSKAKLLLVVATLLTVTSLAVAGSWAAWTATDSNPSNSFSTDGVLLLDNQGGVGTGGSSGNLSGTAIFTVTGLNPGSAATTGCIGVDFTGTATNMTLGAALGGAGQATLQGQLTLNTATYNTSGTTSVTQGSNTNSGACTNYPAGGSNVTVGTQGATLSSWSGSGPYAIASPLTHTWYKFTVSGLPGGDTDCTTYCNQTITITFTWTLTAT